MRSAAFSLMRSLTFLLVVVSPVVRPRLASAQGNNIHDWQSVKQLHRGVQLFVVTANSNNACRMNEVTEEHIRCVRKEGGVPIEYTVVRPDVLAVWKEKAAHSPLLPIGLGAVAGAAIGSGVGIAYSGSSSGTVVGRTAALGAIVGALAGYRVSTHRSHEPKRELIFEKNGQ